jgi:hypothetical protein
MRQSENASVAEKSQNRIIVRIELTRSAKEQLENVSSQRGMTQVAVCSRLLEWFGSQSDIIQSAVLGHYPHIIQEDIAQLILKHMAKAQRS